MRTRRGGLLSATTVVMFCACHDQQLVTSTAHWAVTGRAVVMGMVVDSLRQPLDSFHVSVRVNSSAALFSADFDTTRNDGSFAIDVEQQASSAPGDSAPAEIVASSLRTRDRNPDGTPRSVRENVWLHFAKPPADPTIRTLTLTAPTRP